MNAFRSATLCTAVVSVATCLLLGPGSARGEVFVVSVDWDPGIAPIGQASGRLGALAVSFASTDGPVIGGVVLGENWQTSAGTNDLLGLNRAGIINEGVAFDWNGVGGFVRVDFIGGTVTDPILLFGHLDSSRQAFDFEDSLSLSLLDQNPAGSISIAAGNVVTSSQGTHANTMDDSFAMQLNGTFSSITFDQNLGNFADSVTFTVAVRSSVPEPGPPVLLTAGALLFTARRRRKEPAACASV